MLLNKDMKKIKILVFFLPVLMLALLPTTIVWAENTVGGLGTFQIENPINANNFEDFLTDILNIIVQIGVPVLVLMTIYTGFKFVAAKGNAGELTKAKAMFFNLIIGAFIILGCFAISQALQNTVSQLGPVTTPTSL